MSFSAVILAGGKSSRMGRDKAWLEVGGQTLLARQIGIVREAGALEIFISGRADVDYSSFGCRVLKDKFQNAGPLAGIVRALDASTSQLLLVLAVDMPNMSVSFLQSLATKCAHGSGAIPRVEGRIEPLAVFYPKAAHTLAVMLLDRGCYAVTNFAECCVKNNLASFVDVPESDVGYFANWNAESELFR